MRKNKNIRNMMKENKKNVVVDRRGLLNEMYEISSTLFSNIDFDKTIFIYHLDGSFFHLKNAHLLEDKLMVFIYTEHCGFLYFYKEDLEKIRVQKYELKDDRMFCVEDKTIIYKEEE
jgi:mRNA-degrading endonuclease YafQ of YafQ-DinJ toxin-antitoxin module